MERFVGFRARAFEGRNLILFFLIAFWLAWSWCCRAISHIYWVYRLATLAVVIIFGPKTLTRLRKTRQDEAHTLEISFGPAGKLPDMISGRSMEVL